MISKITMDSVASYRKKTSLLTDKRINLIYGLNGTGKSTFSNYMYDTNCADYNNCSIEEVTINDELLVYNQKFISDNFYEAETLKGIFTLSKENKDAKTNIDNANEKINDLNRKVEQKVEEREGIIEKQAINKSDCIEKIWDIKKNYSDIKELDYCFEGLKKEKTKLFEFLLSINYDKVEDDETIEKIVQEVRTLKTGETQKNLIDKFNFNSFYIENDSLFNKVIVGNKNSTVSDVINQLGCSDWVKSGLKYIDNDSDSEQTCPFCQSKTISLEFLKAINEFFDEAYEKDINTLKKYQELYSNEIQSLSLINIELDDTISQTENNELKTLYNDFLSKLKSNLLLIQKKIELPGSAVDLIDTSESLEKLNDVIIKINDKLEKFNIKIQNKEKNLKELYEKFWKINRYNYDIIIKNFKSEEESTSKLLGILNDELKNYSSEIAEQNKIIIEEQRKTINIDEAINNINLSLKDIGVTDFFVEKVENNDLYRIVRSHSSENIFKTLSEGEKMIISFLYFIEMCKGIRTTTSQNKKRIIVIDDPITSMSHIYIFNVGRLIKNEFFDNSKYEQIFVLTHSLYFFYELAYLKKEDRDENQKLIRLTKNELGSEFEDIHYNEIQNDYQAYWPIIKDKNQHPALIANCMRNIIEYFFGFVEKNDLNNIFQRQSLKNNRFQSFNRYINRESHSIGQNIFDLKEFNYDDFKEAFRLVFYESGYENHYKKMIGE